MKPRTLALSYALTPERLAAALLLHTRMRQLLRAAIYADGAITMAMIRLPMPCCCRCCLRR
jgi:hypothetical protein